MLKSWTRALRLTTLALALGSRSATATVADVDAKTDEILARLSLDDMIGQMTQLDIISVLNNGVLDEAKVRANAKRKVGSYLGGPFMQGPIDGKLAWTVDEWRAVIKRIQEISMEENGGHPVIYGVDSVHGAVLLRDATLFGQQINAGASFNADLVHKMGAITAKDTVASGAPWIFGPILEVSQNKLWSRTYETFGEDPYLVSVMGSALIKGMQESGDVAACMKHFVGYSKAPSGRDREGVAMSDFELLNRFAPPFVAAVEAGVKTAMENYVSINGEPVVGSSRILKDLLRHDLGFEGFVVTDYNEIANLNAFHRVADSPAEAVRVALAQTTIDMSMVSYGTDFIDYAKAAQVLDPTLLDRIKASARRVIKTKVALGLYENPVPGGAYNATVGQAADRAVALDLARESIVLLQNKDNVLPIAPSVSVFLTGPSADDVGNLCGGWTLAWQGYAGSAMYPKGISIKKGMETVVGAGSITYLDGVSIDGIIGDLHKAKKYAEKATYTVVAIGEGPYAEKPGDIDDLALPAGQIEYVKQLATTGTKVIVVLVGGRPRLLNGLPSNVHAVINAMLPCEAGGQAIAEIIYGKVNPSGRLPISYPKFPASVDLQYNHYVDTQCTSGYCAMEWEFGAGISYATFTYNSVTLSKNSVSGESDSLTATVTVTNIGKVAGKETVMLFLSQPYRSMAVPEVKQLKAFEKIELAPGASQTVTFTLGYKDWSVYKPQIGQGFAHVAERGVYVVAVKPETKCDVYSPSSLGSGLCAAFSVA